MGDDLFAASNALRRISCGHVGVEEAIRECQRRLAASEAAADADITRLRDRIDYLDSRIADLNNEILSRILVSAQRRVEVTEAVRKLRNPYRNHVNTGEGSAYGAGWEECRAAVLALLEEER